MKEIKAAISKMKNNKAPGGTGLLTDMLKTYRLMPWTSYANPSKNSGPTTTQILMHGMSPPSMFYTKEKETPKPSITSEESASKCPQPE
jgi:hypothetical protein